MSKYRITIEELLPPKEGSTYDKHETIYQQTVEELQVEKLIIGINGGCEDVIISGKDCCSDKKMVDIIT